MQQCLSGQEINLVRDRIKEKYARVAATPAGRFRYPTGEEGLRLQKYPQEIIQGFPKTVRDFFCGVGNPFSLGPIHQEEAVLDIGCGAGVDVFVAARLVGPLGRVVGIDVTDEMVDTARKNLALLNLPNVSFQVADAESLPFPDHDFDVIISSGVFNLILNKEKALREAYRVLKPGGRFMVADMVLVQDLPPDRAGKVANWYQ